MSTDDRRAANKQLILDYFRDVVASFDVGYLPRYVAEDFVLHGPDALVGIDAFRQILLRDYSGHPPLDPATVPVLPPTLIVAEDDLVTICFSMPAIVPGSTGETYDLYGYHTYRIRDGFIVERWTNEHMYSRPQLPENPTIGADRTASIRVDDTTDVTANKQLVADFYVSEYGLTTPAVLQGDGDLVVIAVELPQPLRDGSGGEWSYFLYDAFRITDGELVERWSGIDAHDLPVFTGSNPPSSENVARRAG